MEYGKLLKAARKQLPEAILKKSRFEVPKVKGHIQGNRTVISNFNQIADFLRKDVNHLVKYVLKELAAPGNLTKTALIIGTKVGASRVNEKINQYVKEYVLCPECGKPDTKIEKEENFLFLKCMACGAKHSIKAKI